MEAKRTFKTEGPQMGKSWGFSRVPEQVLVICKDTVESGKA
jgi:hypothetical protein